MIEKKEISREDKKSGKYKEIIQRLKLSQSKNNETLNIPKTIKEVSQKNIFGNLGLKNEELINEENNFNLITQLKYKLNDFQKNLVENKEYDNKLENDNDNQNFAKFYAKKASSISHRIFWDKTKMDQIRQKFKIAREKIERKTIEDFKQIKEQILEGDKESIM